MSSIAPGVSSLCQDVKSEVDSTINEYSEKFDTDNPEADKKLAQQRVQKAQTVTESFYNLVTDFYEYGWGQSFHFTPIYDEKSFDECIASYEHECARMIKAKPGMKILVSLGSNNTVGTSYMAVETTSLLGLHH